MYRQIIGYIPSNLVPALVSVAMIYAYTRLLSPAEFGIYSFAFSVIFLLQSSLFYALPVALMRFYPAAALNHRHERLLKQAYVLFYASSLVVVGIGTGIALLMPLPPTFRALVWLAIPVLLLRSVVQLNQAANRSANRMGQYNLIECLHAVLGFGVGVLAIYVIGHNATAILLGLLVAAAVCAALNMKLLASPLRRHTPINKDELVQLIQYACPLVAVAATGMILQNGDRLLLGSLAGAEMLGIYAVAYNLVDRPTNVIASAISAATFPLVVQVLEHNGKEAARIQSGRNGIALLAVTLPSCVGLAMTADYIATAMVGPDFRPGVAALLPILAVTVLGRGLRAHFMDHAFHLSNRPLLMLWSYGPATVANIAINLVVVPRWGMFGAAWTALGCQWLTVIVGWFLGTSLFPIWLPVGQVLRCVLAVLPMAAFLELVRFPPGWTGLLAATCLGGLVYVVCALLLDVGEVRTIAAAHLRHRREQAVVFSR